MQYIFIRKIHRFLDIIEYGILLFAKSRFLYKLKKFWFYIKYYATEEGQLYKLISE
jgi:hypothetical protein